MSREFQPATKAADPKGSALSLFLGRLSRPYAVPRADQSGPRAVRRLTLSEWLFIAVLLAVAVMVILFLAQQATNALSNMPGVI